VVGDLAYTQLAPGKEPCLGCESERLPQNPQDKRSREAEVEPEKERRKSGGGGERKSQNGGGNAEMTRNRRHTHILQRRAVAGPLGRCWGTRYVVCERFVFVWRGGGGG